MKNLVLILVVAMLAVGCTTIQKGAGVGAAIGAGLGAVIGHQSGETAAGAAIGAAAGGLGGALIGEQLDKKFCPECGRRFKSSVQYCPYDGIELQDIKK